MMMSRTFCPWTVREIPLYWGCWTTGCLSNHRHRHRHCHDNHQNFTLAVWGQFCSLAMFSLWPSSSSFSSSLPPVNHLEPSGVSRSVPRSVHSHLGYDYDNIVKVYHDIDEHRDAKSVRYGRYVCAILSKALLIFGPQTGTGIVSITSLLCGCYQHCGHSTDLILEF